MEKDTLRMQFLSGVITESEYKAIINKEIEDAEKSSLNESMIGGIVGIGAINQIPSRAKADYETAFEHFLGGKYGLNEVEIEEAEMPAIDSKIANDPDFQKLASYFKQNPDKAEDVKDELSSLKEAYEKDGKYYDEDAYGDKKEVTFKKYLIAKLVNIGLPAAVLGLVGALIAGPLGAMAPGAILQAIGVAAGIGGAAGAALDYGETKPIGEVKIEEGAFGDLLSRMENNTRMAADILTVITLAKEDKEGNAEKAVELLMKNHNLSEEAALEAVIRIFKKAFEWVDSIEEAEMPAIDSKIANDPDFQKLASYFKQNPDKAEDVKDELKTLEENWIKKDKGYLMQDGVDEIYVYFKDNKYYKEQSLSDGSGFVKPKTDEISKEEFQSIKKEYWKEKLVTIGLGAAAVGLLGAVMAGPLGAMDPGNILQAALIAAGFGGAAASIFE